MIPKLVDTIPGDFFDELFLRPPPVLNDIRDRNLLQAYCSIAF